MEIHYYVVGLRSGDQGGDPAGAVVVRAWPGHRNIGRGSCRSAVADGVERRSTAVGGAGVIRVLQTAAQWVTPGCEWGAYIKTTGQ